MADPFSVLMAACATTGHGYTVGWVDTKMTTYEVRLKRGKTTVFYQRGGDRSDVCRAALSYLRSAS